MLRAVIYARYSSDSQRDASIDDQIRLCKERIEREGWTLSQVYRDRAMSGASSLRPGYQALLAGARAAEFDVIVAEALDRLSRDQEDVAALFKRARHADVRIVTLAEGEIGELHIGLKGTMNALFLRDLADKTRRGLRGRVEQGQSAGGLSFGYDMVRTVDGGGEPVRGARAINDGQAATVRRVFEMFAAGESPIAIAKALNAEGVPGPGGRSWRDTTIRGHAERGTGLLRNELYAGRLVWNRMRYVKDPATGRRVSRMNQQASWVHENVPALRIVDDALWARVQQRLGAQRARCKAAGSTGPGFWERRFAPTVLSGKVVCGACGGTMVNAGRDYLACTAARKQGTCTHTAGIRRERLEALVFGALRTEMMAPGHVAVFVEEFTHEWNRLHAERGAARDATTRELQTVERKLAKLVDAITEGLRGASLQRQLDALESRKAALEVGLRAAGEQKVPALHPNLAEVYRARVASLQDSLRRGADVETVTAVRALIERITVHSPKEGGAPAIEILGELAAMVRLGRSGDASDPALDRLLESSTKVVAGTGFEPVTFRL